MTRQRVALALVVVGCLLAPLAVTARWARDRVLDTDTWVAEVGPLVGEPEVSRALASRLSAEVLATIDVERRSSQVLPDPTGRLPERLGELAEGLVEEAALVVVSSDAASAAWVEANRVAHRTLVRVVHGEAPGPGASLDGDGALVVDLGELAAEVLDRAGAGALGGLTGAVVGDGDTTVTLLDAGQLRTVRRVVAALDALSVALAVLVAAAWTGAVAVARRRAPVVLVGCAGSVVTLGALALVATVLRGVYLDGLRTGPDGRVVAGAVYDAVVGPLRDTAVLLLLLAGVVALVVVVGPPLRRVGANGPPASSSPRPSGRSG